MEAGVERPEHSPRPPPLAASAPAIEAVLGDDDLLREILLRLGFPTCLVRAAAVSKRWLHHASDPAFLRRFRDLNPPRLLGFYLTSSSYHHHRRLVDFLPILPQPPELASVLRRGSFSLSAYEGPTLRIMDCRNGRVFISLYHPAEHEFTRGVHTTLHPARGLVTVPDLPVISHEDSVGMCSCDLLSKESGVDFCITGSQWSSKLTEELRCMYICCKTTSGACLFQQQQSLMAGHHGHGSMWRPP